MTTVLLSPTSCCWMTWADLSHNTANLYFSHKSIFIPSQMILLIFSSSSGHSYSNFRVISGSYVSFVPNTDWVAKSIDFTFKIFLGISFHCHDPDPATFRSHCKSLLTGFCASRLSIHPFMLNTRLIFPEAQPQLSGSLLFFSVPQSTYWLSSCFPFTYPPCWYPYCFLCLESYLPFPNVHGLPVLQCSA